MTIPEILRQFHDLFIGNERFYSVLGTAINVDEEKRTCDLQPVEDTAIRTKVRLQSVISETQGFVLIPKEGSFIAVSFFDKSKGFVALTSELEKIIIDTALVQFNRGDNGGLINIEGLVNRMNNMENKLNGLVGDFNAHTHATTATIQATSVLGIITPTAPPSTNIVSPITNRNDFEDNAIKH